MFENFWKKSLWLAAGLLVGIGISSTFAESRTPASYSFQVLAVSEEDATDKAVEMLRSGELKGGFDTTNLLAATKPTCAEAGANFACETRLLYRR